MLNYSKTYFENIIVNSDCYFAHLPKEENAGRSPELLSEHSALVFEYARKIVQENGLDGVVKGLISASIPEQIANKGLLANAIDDLFWQAIAFHDLGKMNKKFQTERMNNNNADLLSVKHPFGSHHSIISVYLYLALFFERMMQMELSDEEQVFLSNVALYLSCTIFRHHSATMEQCQDEQIWCNQDLFSLSPYLSLIKSQLDDVQIVAFHNCFLMNANFNFFFERFNEDVFQEKCGFPLYVLVKLNYSLLTASDYLATAHYMNNWKEKLSDFGIIDEKLRNKIVQNARESKSYNKQLYEAIDKSIRFASEKYVEQNNANLNLLRQSIAAEVVLNTRVNKSGNLFYIEAPTGGGKTNASMLAAAELLKQESSMQKIFYVFPFTTLITQTYKSVKETYGLEDSEIAELHSKAAINTGKYEDDYQNYLDNLLMNYPVSLMSHVKFFEILKTNDKEQNYLLHRLANSIVIIDEIQSYSPRIWDKMMFFISNYARYFNIKFILMSATLPKINKLIDNTDFVYLISDKDMYFKNPNFCNRVKFDYSLLDWEKPNKDELGNYLDRLGDVVIEKSEEYAALNSLYPNSVHTIIEFIFKKTASEFLSVIRGKKHCFDAIFLLSGTILEPKRKDVISKLKSTEYRNKKVLLITTQVVEAGVDIDMDLGFKDKSLIDSEEQLAGRINRNVNKPQCTLFVFDCNAEKVLYGKDDRYQLTKDLGIDTYKSILSEKSFDKLYDLIIGKINRQNRSKFIENINDLLGDVSALNFRKVRSSFKIIDQNNFSIFVPLSIDTTLIDKEFLDLASGFGIPYDKCLNGENVWAKYVELVQNQNEDFVKNKVQMKKFHALLSLFTFTIFPYGKERDSLIQFGREEYGFLFLESYKDKNVYSFDEGINTEAFIDLNFL